MSSFNPYPEGSPAAAEHDRLRAILTAPEAHGRREQAVYLACDTDLTPDQAIGLLAMSPASASTAKSRQLQIMEGLSAETVRAHADDSRLDDGAAAFADTYFTAKRERH